MDMRHVTFKEISIYGTLTMFPAFIHSFSQQLLLGGGHILHVCWRWRIYGWTRCGMWEKENYQSCSRAHSPRHHSGSEMDKGRKKDIKLETWTKYSSWGNLCVRSAFFSQRAMGSHARAKSRGGLTWRWDWVLWNQQKFLHNTAVWVKHRGAWTKASTGGMDRRGDVGVSCWGVGVNCWLVEWKGWEDRGVQMESQVSSLVAMPEIASHQPFFILPVFLSIRNPANRAHLLNIYALPWRGCGEKGTLRHW